MSPDKLFDYLDGNLSAAERSELERRLISDQQLQRELAMARRIHAGMRGPMAAEREVLLPPEANDPERGRKLAWRVGVAFIILMALNVGIGLWLIARHETKNPNRQLLEAQMRKQLTESIERAAAATLSPAPNALGVTEITIGAAPGKLEDVADQVAATAQRLGGSATKGIPEQNHVGLLIDLPANREMEFRAAIAAVAREATGSSTAAITAAEGGLASPTPATATPEKISFVVQIVEAGATAK
jgi:anti-sigma factor RsiW